MNIFRQFPQESVQLERADGSIIDGIRAIITSATQITVGSDAVAFQEGERILRKLRGGIIERYLIREAHMTPKFQMIPAHYRLTVQKESAIPFAASSSRGNVYNVTGPNARINVGSHDASTNIITVTADQLFSNMASTTEQHIHDPDAKRELLAAIERMKNTSGAATFKDSYIRFMSIAADHLAVFQPFLVGLSQLLGMQP